MLSLSCKKRWLPNDLIENIKIKNKLYNKYLKNPTDKNHSNYKIYRNVLNRKIREAEKDHYSRVMTNHTNNPRKAWQVIKEIINKKEGSN